MSNAPTLADITGQLEALEADAAAAIADAADAAALEQLRIDLLGKKGKLSGVLGAMGKLPGDQRPLVGQRANVLKSQVQSLLQERQTKLRQAAMDARIASETIDITLPASYRPPGHRHPLLSTTDDIVDIFCGLGYRVVEGPDIETDHYNFSALNIPEDHPARDMQDTFYLGGDLLMRTHTSPVQIRTMETAQPPIRVIAPGRTYRSDSDATHTPMFHQIEALVIDETTHMGHLKGCIIDFCRAFFDIPDLPVRFRPSHFPFTEPSMEVDIGCSREGGELRIGNFGEGADNWLEIMGSGMVHPKVLEYGGIESAKYQGFAFGMGIDRIAMLKYGIPDLRTFFDADIRWLKHYGFVPLAVPSMVRGL